MQGLFRHQSLVALFQFAHRTQEPLLEFYLQLSLNFLRIGTRSDSPNQVEPVLLGKLKGVAGSVNQRFSIQREPERRAVFHPVAIKSGWRDSDHGKRVPV